MQTTLGSPCSAAVAKCVINLHLRPFTPQVPSSLVDAICAPPASPPIGSFFSKWLEENTEETDVVVVVSAAWAWVGSVRHPVPLMCSRRRTPMGTCHVYTCTHTCTHARTHMHTHAHTHTHTHTHHSLFQGGGMAGTATSYWLSQLAPQMRGVVLEGRTVAHKGGSSFGDSRMYRCAWPGCHLNCN